MAILPLLGSLWLLAFHAAGAGLPPLCLHTPPAISGVPAVVGALLLFTFFVVLVVAGVHAIFC
jgi:hypothetical protein